MILHVFVALLVVCFLLGTALLWRLDRFHFRPSSSRGAAKRNTPLSRLKTPSQQIALVLSALAAGLDPSAAERVFGFRPATITTLLTRTGEHAQNLHERFFSHLWLPHLQLDELRTRLLSHTQVQWLWLSTDPLTKILPVLSSAPGHSTVPSAHPLTPTETGPRLPPALHQ